jgi:hypothetical protein
MADIELFSRHMALDTIYSADVSGEDTDIFAAWLDITKFEKVVAFVHLCTAASNLTNFELVTGNTAAGGTPTTVATLTTPANINAANETAMMEVRASQIQGVDADAIVANVSINSAGAVPVVVGMLRYNPRYAYASLTTATETAWT